MNGCGSSHATRTTCLALLFEGGLGGIAFIVGWLVGQWPAIGITWNSATAPQQLHAAALGFAASLPMLAAMFLIDRFPIGPLANLRDLAHRLILQMFSGASVLQLGAVALVAGIGEELLFRGLLQTALSRQLDGQAGPWIGLVFASLLFGVCHWLNTTYGVLAILAGMYFGVLLIVTGNLWAPIVAHSAYDFIALIYLVRPQHLVRSTVKE